MRTPELQSKRLVLRAWRDDDAEPFARLNADPRVMEHLPAVLSRSESDEMIARIRARFATHGFGLWAVEAPGVAPFLGFVGLSVPTFEAPFTPCVEIGWRIAFEFWGKGYAREAARTALTFAFETGQLPEVVSFTVPANTRSTAVMRAIGMTRSPADDFDHPKLPEGDRLRRHVLYRLAREEWVSRNERDRTFATTHDRARAFADALDADDFERARPLLAPDCIYEVRGTEIRGADAILRAYADATRRAHAAFDQVAYESVVDGKGSEARIHFTDILRKGEREHRHRCVQHLAFGPRGVIVKIVHEDLPGEREAVRAFLESGEAAAARIAR